MRVYLDNCCYNRPYDNQLQIRVSLESQAKLFIQEQIRKGALSLATSYVLDYENGRNPFSMRRKTIADFLERNSSVYVDISKHEELTGLTEEIKRTGIKHEDARHLACAIFAKCDYFITTDKRVLKYKDGKIKTINPLDFVELMEGLQDE